MRSPNQKEIYLLGNKRASLLVTAVFSANGDEAGVNLQHLVSQKSSPCAVTSQHRLGNAATTNHMLPDRGFRLADNHSEAEGLK